MGDDRGVEVKGEVIGRVPTEVIVGVETVPVWPSPRLRPLCDVEKKVEGPLPRLKPLLVVADATVDSVDIGGREVPTFSSPKLRPGFDVVPGRAD